MNVHQIVETLKSSFLMSFRTGNVVVDTIMTGVLVCLTTYLVSMVRNLQYVNPREVLLSWFGPTKPQENKIIVSGKKIQGADKTRVEYSTTFCAVIHQIKKLDCVQADITELSEIEIKTDYESKFESYLAMRRSSYDNADDDDDEKERDVELSLIVSQDKPFKLAEDVYGIVKIYKERKDALDSLDRKEEGKNDLKSEEFQIVVKSAVLSMDSLRSIVKGWIYEYQQSMKHRENKIIVSGVKMQSSYRTRLEYTPTFYAVLHQIKKLDCGKANITELREIDMKGYDEHAETRKKISYLDPRNKKEDDDDEEKEADTEANLMVNQSKPFKLADDVYGMVKIKKGGDNNINKERNKDADGKSEEIEITIKTSVLSMNSLRLIVNGWIQEYQQSVAPDQNLRYFCYSPLQESPNKMDKMDRPPSMHAMMQGSVPKNYTEFKFDSGKNFDNVFFPEKDDVVEMIDFFATNKSWYKKRGIPYTLGFLLHGEPGCGKTSTIKAIANHTRRHIVSVPLDQIKTTKELLSVFNNAKINGKDIPMDRRLYVLEDIDAGELKDVVADRAGKDNTDSDKIIEVETDDQLTLLNLLKIPNVKIFDPKKHRLTLAVLLEVLDGVMEMDGRMLVITTNYPERLDKALIRPGRIDMKLEFGRCTRNCLVAMYQHFFQATIPEDSDKESLPDKKWTPAEVIRVFLHHMRNPPEALKYLITAKPQDGSDMTALVLNREKRKEQNRQRDEEEVVADKTNNPPIILDKVDPEMRDLLFSTLGEPRKMNLETVLSNDPVPSHASLPPDMMEKMKRMKASTQKSSETTKKITENIVVHNKGDVVEKRI